MSIDITPEERAELERRIDCPVPWCRGGWLEHGGDGAGPESWYHDEEHGIELGHDAVIGRSREGSGPVVWSFAIDRHGVMNTAEPSQIVRMLRELADEVERVVGGSAA